MNAGGLHEGSLVTTPMAILEDRYQLMVEEGIPLFELHKTKGGKMDSQDLGYLNVRVSDNYDGITRVARRTVRWFSGKNAYITYHHRGKGVLVAFCPDDINERHEFHHWSNRIRLASTIHSGTFRIVRYHTINGVLPEGRITEEILFISKLIHTWKANVENESSFRSDDINEVRDFVRSQRAREKKVSEPIFSKREDIEDLISMYRSEWVYSPAFQTEILPEIKEKVAAKFAPTAPVRSDFARDFQNHFGMSVDELKAMLRREPAQSPEGKPLEELTDAEVKRIAVPMKISISGKTRDEIIREIKAGSNSKSSDISDIVGPETEEEKRTREAALKKEQDAKTRSKNTFRESVEL